MVETEAEKLVHVVSDDALLDQIESLVRSMPVRSVNRLKLASESDQSLLLVVISADGVQRLHNELNVYLDNGDAITVFTANVDVLTPSYLAQ